MKSSHATGIAWMLLATFLFVTLDATAKYLTTRLPVEQVVWARFVFHLALVALWLVPRGAAGFVTRRPGLQFLRACFMLGANLAFFIAIRTMSLVDASAIVFCGPLFVTALSVPLLGERVGPRRWAAVFVGFVGAMIIIRPGADVFSTVAILPLLAALSFAFYQILTRLLAPHDPPLTTLMYTATVGTVVMSVILPEFWVSPTASDWFFMVLAGVSGAAGQLALIRAIGDAPVSVVAPFNYVGLVWASLFGFALFNDIPDFATILGAVIIAASGLYILRRERALAGEH